MGAHTRELEHDADGLVRIYSDPSAEASPGLVWMHGGGFAMGSVAMPEAHWVAETLASRGIVVISVDYRLAKEGCRFPAPSDDVLTAWAWTRRNIMRLGIDPERLSIGGASAGANLAAGAVLRLDERPGSVLPASAVLVYPTLLATQPAPDAALRALLDENPDADRFGPAAVRSMYAAYLGDEVDAAPLAAVPGMAHEEHLARFPRTIIINAEIDELRVSGEQFARTLAAAERSVGVTTQPNTTHGFLNRPDERAASQAIHAVAEFLHEGGRG